MKSVRHIHLLGVLAVPPLVLAISCTASDEQDCVGEVPNFMPLGTSGEYEYAYFDLTTNFYPAKTREGECTAGRHEAKSDGPFSITVWGLGDYASYGYPGGMGVRPLNEVVVPIR